MDLTSRRQLFVEESFEVVYIAACSALQESVGAIGLNPRDDGLSWFLVQTDDANENANLFFQATFGMPDGVRVVMREFGSRLREESQEEMLLVVIEAKPVGELQAEVKAKLEELGFWAFQTYEFDAVLKSHLQQLDLF